MKIDILTLFPQMFTGPLSESILKRAQEKGAVEIKVHNLRDWAEDKHHTTDLPPYGGGAGMVMRVDVIDKAVTALKKENKKTKVILLDTKGEIYKQEKAKRLSKEEHLILIAGHYEGVDQRVHDHLVDEVICTGEYVLTGGEIPAITVVDSVVRLLPEVLGNPDSLTEESFNDKGQIEYPQYTRPEDYKGWKVPKVLLSGNHKEISEWRKKKTKKQK